MNTGDKILIIDDDSRNIFALNAVLKAKGFECLVADSAVNGISMLKERKDIGVVLMDMMMPDMDGYQAIAEIQRMPELLHIPVIAVTAQAMQGDREKCIAAGAWAYISKPIAIDDLLLKLNRI